MDQIIFWGAAKIGAMTLRELVQHYVRRAQVQAPASQPGQVVVLRRTVRQQ